MPWTEILIFLVGVVVGAVLLAAYCVLAINTKRGGAEVNQLRLVFPMYPSVNAWPSHFMIRHRAKKAYEKNVLWRIKVELGRKPAPKWETATVRVTLHFATNRRRDLENYSGAKWLMDAFVRGKIIVDDSTKHLRLTVVEGEQVTGAEYVDVVVVKGIGEIQDRRLQVLCDEYHKRIEA